MSLITAPLPVSPQVMWPLPLSFSVIPPSSRHVQLQSGTYSIPCVCTHTQFSSLRHLYRPTAFMAFSHRVAGPPSQPPLPFPCIFTHRLIYKCNTHASSPLTHACMRAHFLSLPSLSFLCLSQTHPLPGVKLCCRSGSCGVQCVSLAFLASVSPPPPALHTVALNSFVFFFCLVNKCVRSTPHCSGAVVCG